MLSAIVITSLSLSLIPGTSFAANAATFELPFADINPATATTNENPPIIFEKNIGQTDDSVRYLARAAGYNLFLTDTGPAFSLRTKASGSDTVEMRFGGANDKPAIAGTEELVTKTNYYSGNKKLASISNFASVSYSGIYEGIDAVFYSNTDDQLEYDFKVAANADPGLIELRFDGAESLTLNEAGDLEIKTKNTALVQNKPISYQEIDGEKREVESRYIVSGKTVAFELGKYDRDLPLVIDPVTRYLTYVGGFNGNDQVAGIAVDASQNKYITGTTGSTDFTPSGASPRPESNNEAVFIAKINPNGSQYLYITILDGAKSEKGADIAIDDLGNAYITGDTFSKDFPVRNAFDANGEFCYPRCFNNGFQNGDAFVTKVNSAGQLIFSTYLSGADIDIGNSIAVANGLIYITGATFSLNFPKVNEYATLGPTFLTVMPDNGDYPVYSTRFRADPLLGVDVAVDGAGNAYIAAVSDGNNTPAKNALQPNNAGGDDAIVAKFNPFASGEASLVYSTYLGGSGTDRGNGIAVTANGRVHVTGVTGSSNFPLRNAVDTTNQVNEAFLTALNPNGTMLASTFLGGSGADSGNAVAVDVGGVAYVTGSTESNNFPLNFAFDGTKSGTSDAFIAKIRLGSGGTSALLSSSYQGGSGKESGEAVAVLGTRNVFFAGTTNSADLPTSGGSVKSDVIVGTSFEQGFVSHVFDTQRDTVGVFDPAITEFLLRNSNTIGSASVQSVDFGAAGSVPVTADWNGDGIDTVGTFNNGFWAYRNSNAVTGGYPTPPITFTFGVGGDIPVAGDWNGDGIETPGVFRPSTGQFHLSDSLVDPQIDRVITFGLNGDRPVVGDWNGDGFDSPGVYRPSDGRFRLTNDLSGAPVPANNFLLGVAEDLPVAGDWNGDGRKDVGLWRPSTLTFSFDINKQDGTDLAGPVFGSFGNIPLAGEWEGRP